MRLREGDKVIAPAAVLGAAEELGLIHAIGRWVLAQGHHFGKPSPLVPSAALTGVSTERNGGWRPWHGAGPGLG